MNFSQLQERVRLELLRRIERGTLSVSLLARQTGLGQPHVSNFLHGRRGLSLKTLDSILKAQQLQVADLLPARREMKQELRREKDKGEEEIEVVEIPLVSHAVAIYDPYIRASSILEMLPAPGNALKRLEARCSNARKQWDRFVAVRIGAEDARAMEPVLQADAWLVVLDRHYTSFHPYQEGGVNLYGARLASKLVVRYAQFQEERVVLRAHVAKVKAEVFAAGAGGDGGGSDHRAGGAGDKPALKQKQGYRGVSEGCNVGAFLGKKPDENCVAPHYTCPAFAQGLRSENNLNPRHWVCTSNARSSYEGFLCDWNQAHQRQRAGK